MIMTYLALELEAMAADEALTEIFPVLPPLPDPSVEEGFEIAFRGNLHQELALPTASAHEDNSAVRQKRGRSDGGSGSDSKKGSGKTPKGGEKQLAFRSDDSQQTMHRPSRWKRDQSKLGGLEEEAMRQRLLAEQAEAENHRLRVKNAAMEHVLAARERQLSILDSYQKLCGPGSPHQCSKEARELQAAATASITTLVS